MKYFYIAKNTIIFSLLISYMLLLSYEAFAAEDIGFTQQDREQLIRLEITLKEFKEQVDIRFEQVDKRFEQVNERFEQVNKRFEFIQNLLIAMLAVFGGLCGVFVGLLLWDRKTFKEKAKEDAIKEIEEKWIARLIEALKEFAESDTRLMEALKRHHLL